MRRPNHAFLWFFGLAGVLAAAALGTRLALERSLAADSGLEGVVVEPTAFQMRGPSLEGGVGWLNTAGPIKLDELKGKIVLLDFWTYCCINCHHILPELAKLEEKYKNELVVIGVHTAKFFAERETENIRRKVREYGIKHPVVNDADQVIWNRFGVNSWPTLVLIDPSGKVLDSAAGEVPFAVLDKVVGQLVAKHRNKGDLDERPIKFFPENEKPDDTPLLFPGKVLADGDGKRLFIADTAHNRLVISDLTGKNARPVGTGLPGLTDGAYDKAAFNRPQGMCLVGETLYVADTENHALRAVDLKGHTVHTVAGNGQQSHRQTGTGPGKTTALSSPWDVIQQPGTRALFIAMAGPHQIWRYDLDTGTVGVWAGSGREDIIDGPLGAAAFAQPSGLATDGSYLYVADSEVSGVRAISLDKRNHLVRTIVGNGLFVFDDIDGSGAEVRLQHCLGVAYGGGKLYIADSYNNKVKLCDPRTRSVETFVGARVAGDSDSPPRFYQPGGLSVTQTHLYVADTNNHKIRVVDLKEKTVQTLELSGLTPPSPRPRTPSFPNAQETTVAAEKVSPKFSFDVTVPLEKGYKVSPDVPMPYLVETPGKTGLLADPAGSLVGKIMSPASKVTIPVTLVNNVKEGEPFELKVSLSAFVCSEGSSLCKIKSYVWNVPVTVTSGGRTHVELAVPAAAASR